MQLFQYPQHVRRRSRAGMTLIEVMVSMVVLVVAVSATLGSMTSFAGLEESSAETIRAYVGARRTIESMQATSFSAAFSMFNDDATDDPAGVVSPGSGFDVQGLDAQDGDPDGRVGLIRFPVDPATPGELYENRVDAEFGLPRDLNADGVVDAVDHADDYVCIPVIVRVEWTSRSGNRAIEVSTLLSPR